MMEKKESKRKNFNKRIEDVVTRWFKHTTAHGISHSVRTKNYLMKILWILFFAGSFTYCLFTIIQSFIAYLSNQTQISIKKHQQLPILFPAVTICNINAFNERYATNYLNNKSNYFNITNCINNDDNLFLQCLNSTNLNLVKEKLIDKLKRIVAKDGVDFNSQRLYGFDLQEDMLISCSFNKEECYYNNFRNYWDNRYGNCYTFNPGVGKIRKTNKAGREFGLKLQLLVRQQFKTNYDIKNGLYLIVRNQSNSKYLNDKGINLPTGFETYIGIDKVIRNKLGPPYSDCLTDLTTVNPYGKILFKYFTDLKTPVYNRDFCFKLCYQDKLTEKCDCLDIITDKIKNKTYCVTDKEINCMNNFKANFTISDLNQICEYACPEQCSTVEFNLEFSSVTFPTLSYMKYLQSHEEYGPFMPQNVTDLELIDFGRQSLIKIVVNFNSLDTTMINDVPIITSDKFFGTLGGQLGLFIGLSILSFFEVLEFLLQLIFQIIIHLRKK